jgi:hypothetical protein
MFFSCVCSLLDSTVTHLHLHSSILILQPPLQITTPAANRVIGSPLSVMASPPSSLVTTLTRRAFAPPPTHMIHLHLRSSAFATPPSQKAFSSLLQPLHLPAFLQNLPPISSRYAPAISFDLSATDCTLLMRAARRSLQRRRCSPRRNMRCDSFLFAA